MTKIHANLEKVHSRIIAAKTQFGQKQQDTQLLAVSKTRSVDELRQAYQWGQRKFGENYVNEAIAKMDLLTDLAIQWHFIGHIQSNKTRLLAQRFDWVHSVDRFSIAKRLSEQRPNDLHSLNICLQINISNEGSKGGISLVALPELAKQVSQLPNVHLRGLMAIPKAEDVFEEQCEPYRKLRLALESLNYQLDLSMDTLSMGMSNDLEAAIAEGATLVRVGTAIFGPRK